MSEWTTVELKLRVSGKPLELEIPVPIEPTPPVAMLPVFQALTNVFVSAGKEKAEAEGAEISCRAGCGACCRQLVPISTMEAHQIRNVVDNLDEAHRARVIARFEQAKQRLTETGMLERIMAEEPGSTAALGLDYFALGIACPFLEDESCSIHIVRPISCREYLVSSPAEACKTPTAETVQLVKLPGYVSRAVRALGGESSGPKRRWVPLIVALEWAEANPDESEAVAGPALLREVLERL